MREDGVEGKFVRDLDQVGSTLYTSSAENAEADGQSSAGGFARENTKIRRQAVEGVVVGLTLVHGNAII
jgi:hypothetical protein